MVIYEWTEELCRTYAEGLRPMLRFDHRPWARRIAKLLPDDQPGRTIVDIATGPGFLLLELGRLVPHARLVAQDQAEPMLAIAREEAQRYYLHLETVASPAERLDLPDACVDVLVCKQLLHEAADVDRTLSEMARVVRPGGAAFIIDFDADGSRLLALCVRAFLRVTRGRTIGDSFWSSFSSGLAGASVREKLAAAGFAEARYERHGFNYLIRAIR